MISNYIIVKIMKNVPTTTTKKEMNNVKMIIERSENSIKDMNASERCCLFFPIRILKKILKAIN